MTNPRTFRYNMRFAFKICSSHNDCFSPDWHGAENLYSSGAHIVHPMHVGVFSRQHNNSRLHISSGTSEVRRQSRCPAHPTGNRDGGPLRRLLSPQAGQRARRQGELAAEHLQRSFRHGETVVCFREVLVCCF